MASSKAFTAARARTKNAPENLQPYEVEGKDNIPAYTPPDSPTDENITLDPRLPLVTPEPSAAGGGVNPAATITAVNPTQVTDSLDTAITITGTDLAGITQLVLLTVGDAVSATLTLTSNNGTVATYAPPDTWTGSLYGNDVRKIALVISAGTYTNSLPFVVMQP